MKIEKLDEPKKISSNPIFSMDESRNRLDREASELILGDAAGGLFSYDVETEKNRQIGQDKEYRPISKVISVEDKPIIFTFSWERSMQMWDMRTKSVIYTHGLRENFVTAEYMHPYIILISANNSVSFINVETYSKGSSIKEKRIGHDELIRSLAFDKSHEYLALGDIQGKIKILKRNKESTDLNFFNTKDTLIDKDYPVVLEYGAHYKKIPEQMNSNSKCTKIVFPVNAISFNPKDNTSILSAGGDCSIFALDANLIKGKIKDEYTYQKGACNFTKPFTNLKFNEEGTAILTAELDDNFLDIQNNQNSIYQAKSTLRLFKLTEDYSSDDFA